MGTSIEYMSGPNLLVRLIWWLFVGWWASGLAVIVAWAALISIIGIPLGVIPREVVDKREPA